MARGSSRERDLAETARTFQGVVDHPVRVVGSGGQALDLFAIDIDGKNGLSPRHPVNRAMITAPPGNNQLIRGPDLNSAILGG